MFVHSLVFALSARWQDYNTIDLRQYPTKSNNSTAGTLAKAIGMPTGMLPMLDAANPLDDGGRHGRRVHGLARVAYVQ